MEKLKTSFAENGVDNNTTLSSFALKITPVDFNSELFLAVKCF